ncbi:MAG: low molecular weight protein arginine phosphatase [Deltaproteobacteria bacterium]|nr:low molecular weight protein arginine phosphatase [Deltaproteobacteria bacterium]MBW2072262.1 low molecular weight protein arginine phosphatase [Deltaproteobacteria bacterium]
MHPRPESIKRILFVCTGNICRSPMAEAIFRHLLQRNPSVNLEVASAGLIALPGNRASFSAIRVAGEHNIHLEDHQARLLSSQLASWADLILVMESGHKDTILHRYPETNSKILLLRSFARYGSRTRAIADPFGLSLEAYRFCFQDIKECVESLFAWLQAAKRGPSSS